MMLCHLLQALDCTLVRGRADLAVETVCCDSRAVTPGCVFVCLPGQHTDGRRFAPAAAAAGAAGVSGLELAVGAVCRRVLHTAVWDYADEWGNLAGLVCPKYTAYWFLLCGWVIFVLRSVESTVYHPQKSASRH